MTDVKRIMDSILHSKNIFEPLVDKTFDEFTIKNNNYLEKEAFIKIIKDIYKTLRLPPPSNSMIDFEFNKLNRRKDGKLKKEEYKEIIEDLIKVIIDSL